MVEKVLHMKMPFQTEMETYPFSKFRSRFLGQRESNAFKEEISEAL